MTESAGESAIRCVFQDRGTLTLVTQNQKIVKISVDRERTGEGDISRGPMQAVEAGGDSEGMPESHARLTKD